MAEPELGGIWRNLPHEPTRTENAREWAALDAAELRDYAEQQRKFEELGSALDREGLQPSRADFEQTARINEQARLQERWGALERDGVHPDRIEQIIGHEFPKSSYGHDYDFEGLAQEHNRAIDRRNDLISTPIESRRQQERDHLDALRQPQRFPLTGDGEHAERITTPAIRGDRQASDGADLSAIRYQDYWRARLATPLTDQQQRAEKAITQLTAEPKLRQSETVNDGRQARLSL